MPDAQKIHIDQSADGRVQLDVKLERESLWLSQSQIARLFDQQIHRRLP